MKGDEGWVASKCIDQAKELGVEIRHVDKGVLALQRFRPGARQGISRSCRFMSELNDR